MLVTAAREDSVADGLRRYWYIACPGIRLRKRPLAARLFSHNLVLFRDDTGAPKALLDRCCHRGARLSLGRVENGEIACRYHGWRYDGSGRCVSVPSLLQGRSIDERARVPAFACAERDGYVWVWAVTDGTSTGSPPAIPEFERYRWRQGTVTMAAAAARVLENNLDWCHPAFAHPWTHGQFFASRFGGPREQAYEVRIAEQGLTIFAPPTTDPHESPPKRPVVALIFTLPDRVRVEFWRPFHLLIYLHAVPIGNDLCRLEWMMPRVLPFGRHVSLARRTPPVLAQDRLVVESAEPAYRREGPSFERSVPADTSTLLLRLVLRHTARGTWSSTVPKLTHRRIVRVRV